MQKNTFINTALLVLSLLFLLLVNVVCANTSKKPMLRFPDPEICLEVSGKLTEMKAKEGVYTVKLIQDNKVIEQIEVNGKEKFKLNLKRNTWYTIKIEKEGFIPRLVSVCTHMPEKAKRSNLYRFHFDIQLFEESYSRYFDPDDLDFPIALIAYDKNKGLFHYDKKYTSCIQQKMHGMSSTAK